MYGQLIKEETDNRMNIYPLKDLHEWISPMHDRYICTTAINYNLNRILKISILIIVIWTNLTKLNVKTISCNLATKPYNKNRHGNNTYTLSINCRVILLN